MSPIPKAILQGVNLHVLCEISLIFGIKRSRREPAGHRASCISRILLIPDHCPPSRAGRQTAEAGPAQGAARRRLSTTLVNLLFFCRRRRSFSTWQRRKNLWGFSPEPALFEHLEFVPPIPKAILQGVDLHVLCEISVIFGTKRSRWEPAGHRGSRISRILLIPDH